jgi:nucleotide-binding universal stress UspA family protein
MNMASSSLAKVQGLRDGYGKLERIFIIWEPLPMNRSSAVNDFRQARRKANLHKILALFSRRDVGLLSYEEVRKKLKAVESSRRELKEIPMDSIIGSVGRYTDFTRSFLPQHDEDEDRWAKVHVAMMGDTGLPPIEVYQIGETFFVVDGHHRVSIARQIGAPTIEAYVRQVQTKVPLSPQDQASDLIIKSEYADFLDHTRLDKIRPEANLEVTEPGQYEVLEEHISVHRYFMGIDQGREIPYEEAVAHWYDEIYFPIVEVIRERGILRDFPKRTETDLFLWISEHRASLEEALEWEIDPATAAEDLVEEISPDSGKAALRFGRKLLDIVTPDSLESGPPPGVWRKEHIPYHRRDRLFIDVLAPVRGDESGWYALEQAIRIVRKEEGHLRGLLVVPYKKDREGEYARFVREEFQDRCQKAGLEGSLVVEVGTIARKICERARWNDLIVMNLSHPPQKEPTAKLSSGFRTIVRRCPVPILAVKEKPSELTKALLAYDGSRKAREGLFIAAYTAIYWEIPLVVVAINEKGEDTKKILQQASEYLQSRGTNAKLITKVGDVTEAILQTAEEEAADWIIMGGYGMNPIIEVTLGSAVDQVLRESEIPILICR